MITKFINPSSSDRWTRCTGSLELQVKYPTPFVATPATTYGSQVHGFAKALLSSNEPLQTMNALLATYPDSSIQINEAWYFHNYINTINSDNLKLIVETRLDLSTIHPGMQGTPDVILYNHDTLHVVDLKTGMVPVSPRRNTQLMLYAWGALHNLGITTDNISLHIYQDNPRAGHNTASVVVTYQHLQEFISSVKNILSLATDGIFKLNLGEHCKYCPVQSHCPALFKKINSDFYKATGAPCTIDALTTAQVATLYNTIKDLLPLQDRLAEILLSKDEGELSNSNLTIKTRRLPLKYTDENEALQALTGAGIPLDTVAPRALLSPAKLKKLSKAFYDIIESTNLLQPPQEVKYIQSKGAQ